LSGKRLGYLAREEYLINLIMINMAPENDLKNIKYVPLQPEDISSAFTHGKADALFLLDPYRSYMIYLGNISLINGLASSYMIPNIPYGAIVMRKNYVRSENTLAAIRVLTAVEAALSFLTRNPEMAKDYLVAINAWPQESELTMKMRLPDYERLTEINLKSIENMQTDLVRRGIGICGIKPSEFLFQKTDFVR
jgi:ABC-type nitrate/sulfonate/bicarbonate transport system substrate-binding protein